ncbi:glutathione S-transferase [Cryptococcus neoformans var. grubii H99]|uniref:Glutathione S-transferase n=1 Tax=Cryptococcus neoformans (strain H99 / ATCC 208821 / CBS 10515 / FGSC 9487) TaxID=235443 RepID=J9VYH5_CRYN9|nr:glutathione S-transferase [Cryptococcus neoformans var. grubii H99]AFR98466.2 glutathione S-transferase [Cryptococcus neoformans var. grubii H99]AUB28615.1 glutathione S-transferase [Cryptococcus neoformans var. grubii]|eukprot:XP_012053057.1 glutathione S-transferase [Cryptococcus neoformans var. grubii H99]
MPMPDEHIHPTATGLAKKIVDAHQDPQDLVFWSGWFCPFNQRIWIALEERKIPYQYHEVNPYKKEETFLKLNPLGLVPTLEIKTAQGSKALYESDVLAEFLEDLYPPSEEHPSIFPSDPYEKSWVRLNIQHVSKKIIPNYFKLQQSQTESDQDAARKELISALRTYAKRIKGPYFAGEQWTAVDGALAPFVERLYILEKHRNFDEKEVGDGWWEYRERLMARDSLKNTSSEEQYYEEILGRYLRNEAQSEVAKATRAGQSLP